MHPVSRLTLSAAIIALGGLTACGDSIVVPGPGVTPEQPRDSTVREVTITPTQATVAIGGTQLFVANVQGGANLNNRNVTYSSSNNAIATVNSTTGVATGVAQGSVSIIATSAANTAVRAAATLTVLPTTPASISVFQVQNQLGQPATLNNAGGQLNIVTNVDPGQSGLSRVVLLATCPAATGTGTTVFRVDSANVSGTTGSQTGQQVTIPFNTAFFDPATGAVRFRNQTCTLSIEGRTAAGALVTTAGGPVVTLNNADVVVGTIAGARNAADEQGLRWDGGNVTVTVQPVFFSTSGAPASIFVTLMGTDTDGAGALNLTATATAGANGVFTATFTEGTNTQVNVGPTTIGNDMTIPNLMAQITGVTAQGQSIQSPAGGPFTLQTVQSGQQGGFVAQMIRYDNENPVQPTFTFATQNPDFGTNTAGTGFINSTFNFATTPTAASGFGSLGTNANGCAATGAAGTANNLTLCDHDGVDRVSAQFSFTTSNPASVTSSTFTAITTTASIPEAASGSALALRVQACDALQNCNTGANTLTGERFGVDLRAPTLNDVTAPGQNQGARLMGDLTGGGSVSVIATDSASAAGVNGAGFGATPVFATLRVILPSGTTGQISRCVSFNGLTAAQSPTGSAVAAGGTYAATTCVEEQLAQSFVIPNPGNGEYTLSFRVVDQAGNSTGTTTRTFQVDNTAPTVNGGIGIPAAVTTGVSFSTTASDNTDISTSTGVQVFNTAALQFAQSAPSNPNGTIGDGQLTRSSTITFTPSPFYAQIQTFTGAGTASAADVLDGIEIRARDVIGNISLDATAAIPQQNVTTGTAFATTGSVVQQFLLETSPSTVFNGAGTSTTTPATSSSTSLRALVNVGASNTASPFTNVCFYYQSNGGSDQSGATAGEYVLIGCQSAAAVAQNPDGSRVFIYTFAGFNPTGSLGTGSLNVIAVGNNSANSALVSALSALSLGGL